MKVAIQTCLGLAAALMTLAARADETFSELKVGDITYRHVTITSTNATDIFFTHAAGMGNAKLKKLDPELQKHFHFDAARADETEKKQHESNAQFLQQAATNKVAQSAGNDDVPPPTYDNGDIVVPKLYAKSFRGQRPPQIIMDEWLTPPPAEGDMKTKSVLLVFWFASVGPCRAVAPRLNELAMKYHDRLVVLGLSNESPEDVKKMPPLNVSFHVGTDVQARTMKAFGVTDIPHAVLIDPKGIVRFEGRINYLDNEGVEHLLHKYGE